MQSMQTKQQNDYTQNNESIKAIAVFGDKKIKGTVLFSEDLENNCIIINIDISCYGKIISKYH